MDDIYALSGATYDRLNRAASRTMSTSDGGGPRGRSGGAPKELLQIQSSTIGTYGYPAKFQVFDATAGTYGNDPDRTDTVYVIDPAGGTFTASQFVDAMFAGYRGVANESVYVYVKQSSSLPSSVANLAITNRFELKGPSVNSVSIVGGTGTASQTSGLALSGVITYTAFTTVGGGADVLRITMASTGFVNYLVNLIDLNSATASLSGAQRLFTKQISATVWAIVAGNTALPAFSGPYVWGFTVIGTG